MRGWGREEREDGGLIILTWITIVRPIIDIKILVTSYKECGGDSSPVTPFSKMNIN